MKPVVICHMVSSVDGRLHPSRYTASPDVDHDHWSETYNRVADGVDADGWLVGRATMAEMSRAGPYPPANPGPVKRPIHVARPADSYGIAVDRSGKLHFDGYAIVGDHVVVLLGRDVPDLHLAELAADGVSYVAAEGEAIDWAAMLDTLGERFGIRRLLLEGGGVINGSLMAAGLVNELSVIVCPALDGGAGTAGIVSAGEAGLQGRVRLGLLSANTLDHGVVHLRYRVEPDGAG